MNSERQKNRLSGKTVNHTFVVCAYGECAYLKDCVDSLAKQTAASSIMIVTSTPNSVISGVAAEHDLPVFVNTGEHGITQDWNFALSRVQTRYATIAHQDDLYEPEYAERMISELESSDRPIIGFTDYYELHGYDQVADSRLIRVKKILLSPLKIRAFRKSRFVRRRSLSLGCGICCPSVTYCLDNVERPIFNNRFICCEDWETWEKLSRQRGSFVYISKPLISHRIHAESVTTKTVNDSGRAEENYEMFRKFWPAWIAKKLNHYYSKADDLNRV